MNNKRQSLGTVEEARRGLPCKEGQRTGVKLFLYFIFFSLFSLSEYSTCFRLNGKNDIIYQESLRSSIFQLILSHTDTLCSIHVSVFDIFSQNIRSSLLDRSRVHVRAHTIRKLSRDLRSARMQHSCCQNLPYSKELLSCFHANMKVDPVWEATVDVLANVVLKSLFRAKLQVG